MSAGKHDMRTVMGHFATGVCVISTRREDGSPVGTTVNAVTSVSLEPPLLLVCLAHDSETLAAVTASSRFAVSILAASQRVHSLRFAAKGERARPREADFSERHPGLPSLREALATVACRVSTMHRAGDHMIVIGEALSMFSDGREDEPLLFYRGSYSRLEGERERPVGPRPPARRGRVAALEALA
jgi:flavin reductase (DIM6/NTAB) family NADH-FMN oxidoreductase RutF